MTRRARAALLAFAAVVLLVVPPAAGGVRAGLGEPHREAFFVVAVGALAWVERSSRKRLALAVFTPAPMFLALPWWSNGASEMFVTARVEGCHP